MNNEASVRFRDLVAHDSQGPIMVEGYDFSNLRDLIDGAIQPHASEPLLAHDAEGSAGIDDVRDVIMKLHRKSVAKRYVLFEKSHVFRHEAANALLKLLEEPPAQTQIILTSLPYASLPTIRSRCMVVKFLQTDEEAQKGIDLAIPISRWFQSLSDFTVVDGRRILTSFIHEARKYLISSSRFQNTRKARVVSDAIKLLGEGTLSKIALQNIFVAWKYA